MRNKWERRGEQERRTQRREGNGRKEKRRKKKDNTGYRDALVCKGNEKNNRLEETQRMPVRACIFKGEKVTRINKFKKKNIQVIVDYVLWFGKIEVIGDEVEWLCGSPLD